MTRARAAAGNAIYWLLPPLICLLVHWPAFQSWFRGDDFAWLSLDQHIHGFRDLLEGLFAPRAQGTIRPWSERAFFMVGYALFGLNAVPYRVVIFATEFANLALVASIGTRLTGLRWAGFCAALLWSLGTATVHPLLWVCVYNQVLCALFLLLAFHFLLRYIETGASRYYAWQWVVFVLGFGANEANLVYPVLAATYTWLCARRYFWKAMALLPVSVCYAVIHMVVAPVPTTGVYASHWNLSILRTLATYWGWTVGPAFLSPEIPRVRHWMVVAAVLLMSLGLAVFLIAQLRARKAAAAFCVLWFPLLLAPELPLRDHLTDYYPFLSAIGLCWLAGWGLTAAWRHGGAVRLAALTLVAIHVLAVTPASIRHAQWNRDQTLRALHLAEGVAGAHQLHPGETILLDGVDGMLFWNAIYPSMFRLMGIQNVYLVPEIDPELLSHPEWGRPADFTLSSEMTARALDHDQVEVYDVRGAKLRNITTAYAERPRDRGLPRLIDVANPLVSDLLGPEWYGIDTDHRWMPQRATLRMGGPVRPGQHLTLRGTCPEAQLSPGPLAVTVTLDGIVLPPGSIRTTTFSVDFPIPDTLIQEPEIQVAIEVNRTVKLGTDVRPLGLAFGEIRME